MEANNINTGQYWNKIYLKEGLTSWRKYPLGFQKICNLIPAGKCVLEFGSGPGILANMLHQKGVFVMASDVSLVAVDRMKRLYDYPVENISVPPIPKPDDYSDVIVATEFLEHFKDVDKVVSECSRVAPTGVFIVPNDVLGPEECHEHYQKFTIQSLSDLLIKYYDDVAVEDFVEEFDNIKLPCLIATAIRRVKKND